MRSQCLIYHRSRKPQGENYYDASAEFEDLDLQENPTKQGIPVILKTREGKEIELPHYPHPKHGLEKGKRKKKSKNKNPKLKVAPRIQGKQDYLKMVKAKDCQKNRVTGCYKVEPTLDSKDTSKKQGKIKTTKKKSKPAITELERKQKYNVLKRTVKQEWSIEMDTKDTDSGVLNAPSHFKHYTIEERKVILQHPKREP